MWICQRHHDRQAAIYELKRVFGAGGVGVRYCKKHGIVMHTFRHSFGQRKLNEGVPLAVIDQLMGHSITRITEMYARYLTDEKLLDHI